MSIYSGVTDFRDLLSIMFNDDFRSFLDSTQGRLELGDSSEEKISVVISSPADLIPYYAHTVRFCFKGNGRCVIRLSSKSYLHAEKELYQSLNARFTDGVEPFTPKYMDDLLNNLDLLYKIESAKSVDEQKIV